MTFQRWLPAIIALLGFAVIGPALWSGWSGDDAFYSVLDGVLRADRMSLWQAMLHSFELWFFNNGRFYPGLIVEKYLVFYFFTNLVAYKAFLIAMTLVTVELFRRCVGAYVTSPIGNLAALVAIALFAERGYQDPILAYNAMPQVVAIAMLVSLMAFRFVLQERRSPAARAVSIILYAVAALTYEDAYLLCFLYPALAFFAGKTRRAVLELSWPYVATAVVLAAFGLTMRHVMAIPADSMYAMNLAPATFLRTAAYQVVAAFPLSYWIFDPSGIYGRSGIQDFYRNAPVSPIVLLAFGIVAFAALRDAARNAVRIGPIAWTGVLVTVLPALPIAATVKYQHELSLGLGYLPVFFEAFGVALVAVAVALLLLRRFPVTWMRVALSAALAICAAMTQAANVRLVFEAQPSRTARAALERQLAGGLAADVGNGANIAVARSFDWIAYDDDGPDGITTRGLFALYGDRRVDLVPPGDASARFQLRYDTERHMWSIAPLR